MQPRDAERADIANATKKLFSLEVLDRAIRHVVSAKRTLEEEYQRVGDARAVQLIEEKRAVEDAIALATERHAELGRNIDGYRSAEAEIQSRLRALRAARETQERRDALLTDKDARALSLRQATEDSHR